MQFTLKEFDMEDMHQKSKNHDQRQKKNMPEVKWDISIISNGNLARLQSVEETRIQKSLKDSNHSGKRKRKSKVTNETQVHQELNHKKNSFDQKGKE